MSGTIFAMPNERGPILKHSRREAAVAVALWLAAMTYTVGFCTLFGYDSGAELDFVLGVPTWVAWGILAPWSISLAASGWFAFVFMTDDSLE
jgi:hypothetical protein